MPCLVASSPAQLEAAFALRERVFCAEQGVDPAAEFDGLDDGAFHVVALDGDRVVGTCRVLIDGDRARIGRMAVERSLRERGVGAALLAAAERAARDRGANRALLHAQVRAEGFYAKAGYGAHAERFVEEGIEHVAMEKALA